MRDPEPHDQPPPGRRSRVMLFAVVALALGLTGIGVYGCIDRPEEGRLTPYGADYRQAAPVR